MTRNRPHAVSVPGDGEDLRLTALDALARYAALGLVLPGDTLFGALADRICGAE